MQNEKLDQKVDLLKAMKELVPSGASPLEIERLFNAMTRFVNDVPTAIPSRSGKSQDLDSELRH